MGEDSKQQDTPRIEVRGIRKSFGAVDALKGVDLTVYPGEILGVVGTTARARATLMKILSGAQKPDEGSIKFDGEEVSFNHPRTPGHTK